MKINKTIKDSQKDIDTETSLLNKDLEEDLSDLLDVDNENIVSHLSDYINSIISSNNKTEAEELFKQLTDVYQKLDMYCKGFEVNKEPVSDDSFDDNDLDDSKHASALSDFAENFNFGASGVQLSDVGSVNRDDLKPEENSLYQEAFDDGESDCSGLSSFVDSFKFSES